MSCAAMCLSSGPTSDERDRSLKGGRRAQLPQISGAKRDRFLPSSLSTSSYASVKTPQKESKAMALTAQDARSKSLGYPAVKNEAMTTPTAQDARSKSFGSRVAKNSIMRNTESTTEGVSGKNSQLEQWTSNSENRPKQDKKSIVSAVSKIKTKQVKSIITGMGKDLRRAATTVGEKLPNPSKKKNERQRQELLDVEPPRPQARDLDKIKKAYGHPSDPRQAASITRNKLDERGEKISALQRRTTELEANAASYASLTKELASKMESRKWYEI